MEKKPAVLNINGKEYELKFTIGFWKKIKADDGITESNLDARIKDDFPTVAPKIVIEGIRASGAVPPTVEEVEEALDRTVLDVIEQAYMNGMTKAEIELFESVTEKRARALKNFSASPASGSTASDDV